MRKVTEPYQDVTRPGSPWYGYPTEEHPYVLEVRSIGEHRFVRNGLSFVTPTDARMWGRDLAMRWLGLEEYRVVRYDTGEEVHHQ